MAKRKKTNALKYPMRQWVSHIEAGMRNALVNYVANDIETVSLDDNSTSPQTVSFSVDHGCVKDRDLEINDGYRSYGDGDNYWTLYADVRALSYRLDFLLQSNCTPSVLINIECDGHEWHERNKQQASADRARDRDLLSVNILTVRFTGSDIFHRAHECAAEVWKIAVARLEQTEMLQQDTFCQGFNAGQHSATKQRMARHASAYGLLGGVLSELG